MAAPRRRRTNYRPGRRRTTIRRPRRRYGLFSPPVILTASVLVAIGSPTIGIPILVLAVAGLWFMKPRRVRRIVRAPRRPATMRPRMASASIGSYQAMTPGQFEHALAALCRRDGCTNVQVVGGAGDLGADVIATLPDGRRLVIQAKRYALTTKVGSGDVQKVGGTARQIHGADIAAVVTTSTFTPAARSYATQVGIRTLDGNALARWASRTGAAPWQ
ncbi:restriction endonuclease [Kitasatospora sp. NBC_01287]|uniref:restriction endonuclease n=1 Tax=Kitasatospora sp. NBC_01287 TaxID=2903573 RepID=UPI00224E0F1E|nr:restriction endonuclease [Kitasatospora sp. NBC_01287]MCX4750921.1 restriction endonuclease [Kitasatospora sp. NBC_01287]MCX4751828.1 restriction endonuclease [Kitasatospora sp. NBC_01287]MCX4751880.1 restriction endonuclease [Kitasatospora sp. NBC_01287]